MRASLPWLLLLAAATFLAACGGTDSGSDDGASGGGGAGEIVHVSGTVRVDGDGFTLEPSAGGEPIEFTFGPEVAPAEVRALEAAGTTAKVTYRPADDAPVAASVEPAPTLGEDLETYEGMVVSIDASEIVVDGDDGERTFSIADADAEAFDVEHLREHQERDEPIVVYFDPSAPDSGIAYEDA